MVPLPPLHAGRGCGGRIAGNSGTARCLQTLGGSGTAVAPGDTLRTSLLPWPGPSRPRRPARRGERSAGSGRPGAGSAGWAMVGRLSLREVPDLPDMRKRGDSGLDSPDSGLPPSPGPAAPAWPLPSGSPERAAANGSAEPEPSAPSSASSVFSPSPILSSCPPRLCPLSFGEGVEFDPLPAKEIRYTSSVRYGSEQRFIAAVSLPLALSVASCSQTVLCVPDCSWRRYRSEVRFEPRHRPRRFSSTTITYPKHARAVYTTRLHYDCRKTARRFLASVELESAECPGDGC